MQTVAHRALRGEVRRQGRQAAGPLRRPAHGDRLSRVVQAVRLSAAGAAADRDLQRGRGAGRSSVVQRGWSACRTWTRWRPAPARMVAMASPNDAGEPRQFNWARVLRHELVARHHAAADEVQHSALVHRRAGGVVRGLSAAADVERDAGGPRAARKALQSADAQWRLRPPAAARRVPNGLLPGGVVRGVHAHARRRRTPAADVGRLYRRT